MTVLGTACVLITGANVRIVDSIIWDGTRIDTDCVVYNSVLCEKVILHPNTRLNYTQTNSDETCHGVRIVLGREVKTITVKYSIFMLAYTAGEIFKGTKDSSSCTLERLGW